MGTPFVQLEPRRLFAGGIPELPFGVNAEALLTIADLPRGTDVAFSEILRKDNGNFLVIGSTVGDPGNYPDTTFIFTVEPDGSVDDALAHGDLPYTLPRDARILDDGKIKIAGRNTLRLNADGTPDTTFGGGDGVVQTEPAGFHGSSDYQILDDGSVLAVTSNGVTKYDADGVVDDAFGTNGLIPWSSLAGLSSFNAFGVLGMEIDLSGRIVVGLTGHDSSDDESASVLVVRLLPNGAVDSTFSGDGVTTNGTIQRRPLSDSAQDLTTLSSGRIVLMAEEYSDAAGDVYLYAFTDSGQIDSAVVGDSVTPGRVTIAPTAVHADLTPLSDGDFIVSVALPDSNTTRLGTSLFRLNSDFSPDNGFSADGDGKATIANRWLTAVWASETGEILAASETSVMKFHEDASAAERVTLDNGVLRVQGTAVADDILVQKFDDQMRITFNLDEWNFDAGEVTRVEIRAGGGADRIQKSAPIPSLIYGDNGDDGIWTRSGKDSLFGGRGNDTLDGGPGRDNVNGDAGHDLIYGGIGNDLLKGGGGNDYVRGEDGDDLILGNAGKDTLHGHTGNDTLFGGDDHDYLVALNEGADVLNGEGGLDRASADSSDVLSEIEEVMA